MSSFNIKTYTVQITNCATPYAYIMLFDGANYRARLNFSQLQETNNYSMSQNGNFIEVSMNYKTFPSVVDLLRNEKPLSFYWFPATKVCTISSSEEPVGEGEAQPPHQS